MADKQMKGKVMETIYRITDNTRQTYNLEFVDSYSAKKWINSHLSLNDILALGIRPVKVRKG
jgi:hypothetical protein